MNMDEFNEKRRNLHKKFLIVEKELENLRREIDMNVLLLEEKIRSGDIIPETEVVINRVAKDDFTFTMKRGGEKTIFSEPKTRKDREDFLNLLFSGKNMVRISVSGICLSRKRVPLTWFLRSLPNLSGRYYWLGYEEVGKIPINDDLVFVISDHCCYESQERWIICVAYPNCWVSL